MYWGADRETTRRQAGKWRGVWGEKENFLPPDPSGSRARLVPLIASHTTQEPGTDYNTSGRLSK